MVICCEWISSWVQPRESRRRPQEQHLQNRHAAHAPEDHHHAPHARFGHNAAGFSPDVHRNNAPARRKHQKTRPAQQAPAKDPRSQRTTQAAVSVDRNHRQPANEPHNFPHRHLRHTHHRRGKDEAPRDYCVQQRTQETANDRHLQQNRPGGRLPPLRGQQEAEEPQAE
ncbi:hypothetical protein KL911_004228 [Ogataea haglerorum]|uniref:uncharacterized protein n=1 Tax=Ogataea haglerorum TaxID=1937702 RepID=UPI001C8A585C|nr:uncharacterized protein KL911_004228 [Ogataea haglerorum]KAG7746612.1 hypothetical protein KL912_004189 [Ogataea haglerorum]KAG7751982.1 hypothetical protein KL911_004228 [Ogataea haglerorum]